MDPEGPTVWQAPDSSILAHRHHPCRAARRRVQRPPLDRGDSDGAPGVWTAERLGLPSWASGGGWACSCGIPAASSARRRSRAAPNSWSRVDRTARTSANSARRGATAASTSGRTTLASCSARSRARMLAGGCSGFCGMVPAGGCADGWTGCWDGSSQTCHTCPCGRWIRVARSSSRAIMRRARPSETPSSWAASCSV